MAVEVWDLGEIVFRQGCSRPCHESENGRSWGQVHEHEGFDVANATASGVLETNVRQ